MREQSLNRIFGFDLLRSIAILIVVLLHSSFLIVNYVNFPFIPLINGVDLFFVLSGYLIGTIIIKMIEKDGKFTFTSVLHFLKRRWFRTLPNYFLFLFVNIILIYFGLIPGYLNKYLITYFVFFQNLYKHYDFLFWESWSLCVEEWFYLLFSGVLWLFFRLIKFHIKPKHLVLSVILCFLFLPLFYRILYANPSLDFDLYTRKLVLTRLDTIGFGFLGAYIHWNCAFFWKKTRNYFFIIGIVLLTFLIKADIKNIYFLQTFYFSFIGLSILFILPKLESLKVEVIPLKPFKFLSKISYSMYLLHLPLLHVLSKICPISNKEESLKVYLIFWVLNILLSYIIYKIYELPIMNLRDRISKQNFNFLKS